jgi:TRAP-type transport system periplasmic protein
MIPTWLRSIAVALLGVVASCGRNPALEITFAHSAPPQSLIALSAEEFARRANERLAGSAHVTVFGSAALGGDEVILQKLKLGTVDIGLNATVMSSVVDAFALFEMPYLIVDRDHMRRIERELFWPVIAPQAEQKGYKVLGVWENGFRHITNNSRPIVTPADLRGIKLRTPSSPWRVRLFETFGANPTPLPFAEVFMALQTGVVDGQENPLSNVVTGKLGEVQKYLSLTRHVYSPAWVITGVDHWASLPSDVTTVLEQVAHETQEYVFATAERLDKGYLDELRATGIAINEADRASFVKASQPVYDAFGATVPGGRELIERALQLAK